MHISHRLRMLLNAEYATAYCNGIIGQLATSAGSRLFFRSELDSMLKAYSISTSKLLKHANAYSWLQEYEPPNYTSEERLYFSGDLPYEAKT